MINYKPIGIIHSPFTNPEGTPIQSPASKDSKGKVIVYPEYAEGLKDLEGFSHIILIYHFHLSKKPSLIVKPFLDTKKHGVFATHASSRPNPIGISVVRLTKIEKNILFIKNVDIVDQTPLLDIKPYVPEFDLEKTEVGWLKNNLKKLDYMRDDGRFVK
jgi:tRNA-Thr(GGU) m(6)t(6)A37 methyltransferase TsaA